MTPRESNWHGWAARLVGTPAGDAMVDLLAELDRLSIKLGFAEAARDGALEEIERLRAFLDDDDDDEQPLCNVCNGELDRRGRCVDCAERDRAWNE